MKVSDILASFPGPWRTQTFAGGQVVVSDATGKEVPLFTILDLACQVSLHKPPGTANSSPPKT
jgi:hypothetical protein